MKVSLALLSLALASVDAGTRVAVLEVGPTSGMVHRTEVRSSAPTTADAVVSFWSAVHGYGRRLQQSGMTVVPDLFRKPDAGIVISMKNVNLDNFPSLQAIMSEEEEGADGVVGHMEIPVAQNDELMKRLTSVEEVSSLAQVRAPTGAGIFGVKLVGDITDEDVSAMLASLRASTKSVVVHIVMEEDVDSARRRLSTRQLQDNEQEAENADGNADANANNGFYGYGYFNAYNEWVTPYKTMFQIQYFNVVMWTAIGLFLILVFSVYLMIHMPLMSDTLLFGEAARMVGDE